MLRLEQNTGTRSQARRRSLVCRLKDKPAGRGNADEGVAASVTLPDRNSFPGWPRMQSKVTSDWNQLCGWALKSLLWEGKEDRRGSDLLQVHRWVGLMSVLFSLERAGLESDSASSTGIIPTLPLGKVQRGQMIYPRFPLQDSSRGGNKIKISGVCSCCLCLYHVCDLQAKK